MIVTLLDVINAAKDPAILGIGDRTKIIGYIKRAIELAAYKCNWDPYLGTLDLCSNNCGYVTLPAFVGTVLACNVGGVPAYFRNSWYEFHINGLGSRANSLGYNTGVGAACGYTWDDCLWTPTFQDLHEWSYLAALCEDPRDGDGSLQLIVQGTTMDANYNEKQAWTYPTSGDSSPGVRLTLLNNYAATDPSVTPFKSITQVTKPITQGYVKLIGFPSRQMADAVTIGYYAPDETTPRYRRIRVNAKCQWVRVRYRRATLDLKYDYQIVPLPSLQATIELIKAVNLRDTNNFEASIQYEAKAVELLTEIQNVESGPGTVPIQVEPGYGIGTLDLR